MRIESNESQYPRWYEAKTKLVNKLVKQCGAPHTLVDKIVGDFFRFHCFEVFVNVYNDFDSRGQSRIDIDDILKEKAIMRIVDEIMTKGLIFTSSHDGKFERVTSYRLVVFGAPQLVGPSPSKSE